MASLIYGPIKIPNQRADSGLAICQYNSTIFVAYTFNGIVYVANSPDNGADWSEPAIVANGAIPNSTPGLAAYENMLWVMYPNQADVTLYYARSLNGFNWSIPLSMGPSYICTRGCFLLAQTGYTALYLAFRDGNRQLQFGKYTADSGWSVTPLPFGTGKGVPTLAGFKEMLFMVYVQDIGLYMAAYSFNTGWKPGEQISDPDDPNWGNSPWAPSLVADVGSTHMTLSFWNQQSGNVSLSTTPAYTWMEPHALLPGNDSALGTVPGDLVLCLWIRRDSFTLVGWLMEAQRKQSPRKRELLKVRKREWGSRLLCRSLMYGRLT